MAQDVARTWKEYGKLTRVEETVLYAKLRGCKRVGLAFCVGLSQEAERCAGRCTDARQAICRGRPCELGGPGRLVESDVAYVGQRSVRGKAARAVP